jgi:glycosyltransferase involved in cell wall biosynthesis
LKVSVTPVTAPDELRNQLEGDWSELVVYCGGTRWDGNRYTDQHMAERLSQWVPVLYVDPPVSARAAKRDPLAAQARSNEIQQVSPRLVRLAPRGLPGAERPGIHAINRLRTRAAIRTTVRGLGARVSATIVASLEGLFGAASELRSVAYGTDDFVAGAELMGISAARLRREEREHIRRADVVVAISETLAEKWRAMGANPTVITNGVDCAAYASVEEAPWPGDVRLPRPIAGFVGHISDRIDIEALAAIADGGHSLLLVGPTPHNFRSERLAALIGCPNVQSVGPKPFADLPSYMRAIDVGLTPYADTEFNRGCFPLKTLEYLAAGRAAVVSDLPSVTLLRQQVIAVAGSAREFAAAVARALAEPRSSREAEARRALAAHHDWSIKAEAFAHLLRIDDPKERSPCPEGRRG